MEMQQREEAMGVGTGTGSVAGMQNSAPTVGAESEYPEVNSFLASINL